MLWLFDFTDGRCQTNTALTVLVPKALDEYLEDLKAEGNKCKFRGDRWP